MRRGVLVVVLVLLVASTAACGVSGLSFRQDHRVSIVRPSERSEVTLPFVLDWTVDDFEVTGPTAAARDGAGYFAVLVDRTPPPPGHTLDWLFRNDDTCFKSDGCPDADQLADANIYQTSETSLRIDRLPRRIADRRAFHEIVIVLLDGNGRRIGESAFRVEVEHDGKTA